MELLQLIASYMKPIAEIILGVFTIWGTCLTIKIHRYTQRKEKIQGLANKLLAFYCLEQEYLDALTKGKGVPQKNVQVEMRKRAEKNAKNINQVYPDMSPSAIKDYL